jgi:hypothetical protein
MSPIPEPKSNLRMEEPMQALIPIPTNPLRETTTLDTKSTMEFPQAMTVTPRRLSEMFIILPIALRMATISVALKYSQQAERKKDHKTKNP